MIKYPRPEEETVIKNIRNLFKLGKEIKGITDEILRDIKDLFDECYKPVRIRFVVTIILNVKVTVIGVKYYQLKNILIKLDHIYKT